MTYGVLADAALMMLAVPEALAGGAFFMYQFSKIMQRWNAPPMDFSVAIWVGFIACFGMATYWVRRARWFKMHRREAGGASHDPQVADALAERIAV